MILDDRLSWISVFEMSVVFSLAYILLLSYCSTSYIIYACNSEVAKPKPKLIIQITSVRVTYTLVKKIDQK